MFDLSKAYCFYFNEIAKIPHGSYNEEKISSYLEDFAKQRGLRYVRDPHNNVVIYKDGSKGYENASPLILQGHMDMVCEANKDVTFDFRNDPLVLKTEGKWLMASGTTLGADDGVAVAYMLAILDNDSIAHPPLECCFTVQEEVGLVGALKLDKDFFKAKRMICLDHGGEVDTCVSTSGGRRVLSTFKGRKENNSAPAYRLFVSGLRGGHSGSLIHDNRANANKAATRIVKEMELQDIDIRIVLIDGGSKENAIPRECEIIFVSESDEERIMSLFSKLSEDIRNEIIASEKDVSITLERMPACPQCFDITFSKKMIDFLFLAPNGFKEKSALIEGLTITSLNLGVIKTEGDTISVMHSIRSVFASAKEELSEEVSLLSKIFGGTSTYNADYPGWNFAAESALREKLKDALYKISGKELTTSAVHGGNECGVFSSFGVKDIISFGPIMEDIHTPKERLDLDSFDRCYSILLEILKNCND
ncbi:MAG: beta-Ala-His dipeptidase [Erysipelotrichaceae bacterium]|nr:beta-Ala-His dipeptidase [Erysipelotrichaceae bacterium]